MLYHKASHKLSPLIFMFIPAGNTILENTYTRNYGIKKIYLRKKSVKLLKMGAWIYFFLLLFEGAVRKWLLPSFAAPLLVIRDPIAIVMIIMAVYQKLIKWNIYILLTALVALLSLCASVIGGHGNLLVSLFGIRILLIHFPLIFVLGKILGRDDIRKIGIQVLWLSLPMTCLIVLQFYSPPAAWINRGVGDLETAGFSGALGYFRPSATFSFTNGNTLFFGLVAAFNFYFWLRPKLIKRWLLIAGSVCLLIAIPVSISRSLFFQSGICIVFAFIASLKKPKIAGNMLKVFAVLLLVILVLNGQNFFKTATHVFTTRFETANATEGGLVQGVFIDRFLGGMAGAIQSSAGLPFFGYGMGMGTNVGSMLLKGKRTFLIAEGEWGRLIGEMGILLGLIFILIRTSLAVELLFKSYRALHAMNFLPWMLCSSGFLLILQGQWAQPTTLGFATLTGGMILASLRASVKYIVRTEKS